MQRCFCPSFDIRELPLVLNNLIWSYFACGVSNDILDVSAITTKFGTDFESVHGALEYLEKSTHFGFYFDSTAIITIQKSHMGIEIEIHYLDADCCSCTCSCVDVCKCICHCKKKASRKLVHHATFSSTDFAAKKFCPEFLNALFFWRRFASRPVSEVFSTCCEMLKAKLCRDSEARAFRRSGLLPKDWRKLIHDDVLDEMAH
jgi:hypothetical protein